MYAEKNRHKVNEWKKFMQHEHGSSNYYYYDHCSECDEHVHELPNWSIS